MNNSASDDDTGDEELPDAGDPLTKELLEAVVTNAFVLDCPDMTLTQNATASPDVIRGRGSISLQGQPHFSLKLYADPNTDGSQPLDQLAGWVSGTIISDAQFYTLRAVDLSGVVWHCDRVHIKRSGSGRVIISAELEGLKQISACRSAAASVTLFFYDQPDVVYNQYVKRTTTVAGEARHSMVLGAATFETPEFDIRVRPTPTKNGTFFIRINLKSNTLPAGVVYRVVEALSYATFCPVSWCISKTEYAGRREVTLAPRATVRRTPISSPVPTHPGYSARHFWNLFTAFLKHVIHYSDSEHYSPLSAQLRPLIYSETHELIVLALLLTVIVEGILNLEFTDLAQPTLAFKDAIEKAKEAIQDLPSIDPAVLPRVRGALDAMKSTRAGDRLKQLVERGAITQAMVQAWQALRNASAHAAINPESHDSQKLWSQCNTVATLLNVLVFLAIGYSGEYVDYGTPGWPHKPFTPLAPTAKSPSPGGS